jgi:aldehyde dehydrogenase (NAD+)
MYVGMNYIDGSFCPNRPDFHSVNPSTEEVIGVFPRSHFDEVAEAVQAARKAFNGWRELSRITRAEYFDKLCQVLKENKDYVISAISLETGKSLNESLAEFNESLHMAQYTFGMGRMPFGTCTPSEIATKDSYTIRKPKGVVAVISPWNFPCAIGGFWCAAPAIL